MSESTEDDAEIIKQYTLRELSEKTNAESIYKMPVYVENALLGMDEWSAEYQEFITTPLIFIYSDPTSGDGDGDGISDPEDIMPLVTLNYKSTKFSEFVDTAEFFEIKFILECLLMKGYTADECVDCIEILRKYTDTNDVEAFQQEMISAGLVSPDAASSETWFDKIFWDAWAENESAPLLYEYENYANDTSFEELFEKSWYEWSDICKTAFAFWAFGAAEKYVDYMQNWHKISCVPEDYNVHFNINNNSENHKNLSNYSPKEISGMKRNELKRLLPNGWDFQEHNGRIHIRDEKGNFRIRIDQPDSKTNYTHIHIYDANNNCLDIDGNIVSNKSPSGHIPYNN